MPLIYELTNLNIGINVKNITPYLTILIAILLVSKIPTLALKKNNYFSQGNSFFTIRNWNYFYSFTNFIPLKLLLIFGITYLLSIPASILIYSFQNKKIH